MNTILWANLDLHTDLIELFKKVFPSGTIIYNCKDEPSCLFEGVYTDDYASIKIILEKYAK